MLTAARRSVFFAVAWGLALSVPSTFAVPPDWPDTSRQPRPAYPQQIADVQLGNDGSLQGIIVDVQGMPLSNARVTVHLPNREVASSRSDGAGCFSIEQLRGGVYELTVGETSGLVRAWAPGTAPPTAHPLALIVVGDPVVRGQFMHLQIGRNLITGAVIAGAIAAPIIYYDSKESAGVPMSP